MPLSPFPPRTGDRRQARAEKIRRRLFFAPPARGDLPGVLTRGRGGTGTGAGNQMGWWEVAADPGGPHWAARFVERRGGAGRGLDVEAEAGGVRANQRNRDNDLAPYAPVPRGGQRRPADSTRRNRGGGGPDGVQCQSHDPPVETRDCPRGSCRWRSAEAPARNVGPPGAWVLKDTFLHQFQRRPATLFRQRLQRIGGTPFTFPPPAGFDRWTHVHAFVRKFRKRRWQNASHWSNIAEVDGV